MSFTCLSRKRPPGSYRGGGLCGQNPAHADPKGLVQVLLENGGFRSILGVTPLILFFFFFSSLNTYLFWVASDLSSGVQDFHCGTLVSL